MDRRRPKKQDWILRDREKKRVLVIGFEEYSERMYPHTYDFLQELEKHCKLLSYCGFDDRGMGAYDIWRDLIAPLSPKWIFRILRLIKRFIVQQYNMRSSIKKALEEYYDVVISIDHSALNLASRYNKHNSKMVFMSYDILTQDHIHSQSPFIRRILKANRKNITKYELIIVQDQHRSVILDSVINGHNIHKFFLPVCLKDDEFARKVSCTKSRQDKPLNQINIGQITAIESRGSDQLLKAYQDLDNRIILHFQGNISKRMHDMISRYQRKPKLIPFQDSLSKMREYISRMDLGFVAYGIGSYKNSNAFFVSKASGQAVEFIRLGIPVITFGHNDLKEFVDRTGIGIHIQSTKELEHAIGHIDNCYSEYSRNARDVFEKVFDLKLYSEKVCQEVLAGT